MKPLFTIPLFIMFCLTTQAQITEFNTWDEDRDGVLEYYEFVDKFIDEYYNSWDPSQKQGIVEEGFFKNSYAGLDTDKDNMLSDEEWLMGYNYFFDDYVVHKDVDAVDIDENGKVSYQEYYDVMYDTQYFTDIDMDNDNYISEYELADYVFNNWDINETGTISKSEFNRFDLYYLDV